MQRPCRAGAPAFGGCCALQWRAGRVTVNVVPEASERARLELAVMRFGDPAGDGKAEPGAAAIGFRARSGLVGAEEAFENAWL